MGDEAGMVFKFPEKPAVLPPDQVRCYVKERPTRRRDVADGECAHNRFTVDEETREVACEMCGQNLDPVSMLVRWCHWNMQADSRVITMKRVEDKLERQKLAKQAKCKHRRVGTDPRSSRRWCETCHKELTPIEGVTA